jgi:four helix bundle protein
MNNKNYSFERLIVWQKARKFVSETYMISENFPDTEKYGLTNQLRRAAISIASNIAEGASRISRKDQSHFYQIAYSSLMETLSHCYLGYDLGFLDLNKFEKHKSLILELSAMLNALRKSQMN